MLSLIIPYYNDAGCPKKFVSELKKELKGIDYELILVDDCSSDSTLEELKSLIDKRTRVIHNEINKDYGGAIMTGFDQSRGDIIGFSCGDGEVSAKEVVRVFREMNEKDIIKAIRKNRKDGIYRVIISKLFNLWSIIRFGLNIEDINGYPVYLKKKLYLRVNKNLKKDWLFNLDLFRKIKKIGIKITGVKVSHLERNGGKSKMTPKRIFKMIIKYIRY